MQKRVRVAAGLAVVAVVAMIVLIWMTRDRSGLAAPLAGDASGCDEAPAPGRNFRPSAVAIFDPSTGTVVRSAVLGDVLNVVLAGRMLVTDAGDGWLRGFRLDDPIVTAWCLQVERTNELGGSVSGVVLAGDVVVTASGRKVLGIDPQTGAVAWTAPIDGPVTSLSASAQHVYVWTAPGGSQSATILALRADDGSLAWPHVLFPCAANVMAGGTNGDPSGICATPVGPHQVHESSGVAVFHAPGPALVVGVDAETGLPKWQVDAGRAVRLATSDNLVIVAAQEAGELLGIRPEDGSGAFTVPLSGFTTAAAPGVVLLLDQRLGDSGPRRPPANTAIIARNTVDGTQLWTSEVPGIPQRIDFAAGLAFTSSGPGIAAVRLEDGTIAWQRTLATPSRGGPFSVATSWQSLGQVEEGIVAIAAAERPYRD